MYNPKNATIEMGQTLPKDSILDGVITHIQDGFVKEFIPPEIEWKGDKESHAINISVEVKTGKEHQVIKQLFTYSEVNGKTIANSKSNLGKYKEKYQKFPEAGDQVKVITNSEGFGKIKLD